MRTGFPREAVEAPSLEVHKAAGQKAETESEEQSACAGGGTGDLTGRRLRTSMTRRDAFHQAPTGERRKALPPQHPPPTAAIVLAQYTTQETVPFTSRDPPWLLAASELGRIMSHCGPGVFPLEGKTWL